MRDPAAAAPARVVVALGLYVAIALAVAGLLTAPLVALLSAAGVASPGAHLVALRVLKVAVLVGLWPLLAATGVTDRAAWGWARGPGGAREIALGAIAGIATLGIVGAALVVLDVRVAVTAPEPLRVIPRALATGVAVALIEETWFRGVLYGVFDRAWGMRVAVPLSAALWAFVHFVRAGPPLDAAVARSWYAGFAALAPALDRVTRPGAAETFVTLFAAGLVLALVRAGSGRVTACVGLHAGWVLVIQSTRKLTAVDPAAPWASLAGSYDGVTGRLAAAVFVLAALVLGARRMRER